MFTILSQNKQVLFPLNAPITIECNQSPSIVGWFGDKGITLGVYNNQGRAIDVLNNIYIRLDEKNFYIMPQE